MGYVKFRNLLFSVFKSRGTFPYYPSILPVWQRLAVCGLRLVILSDDMILTDTLPFPSRYHIQCHADFDLRPFVLLVLVSPMTPIPSIDNP